MAAARHDVAARSPFFTFYCSRFRCPQDKPELVTELDNAQHEDLGSNKGTVDQMTTVADELSTLVKNKASAEEIAGKIQPLSSAANSLPGEVDATMLATPPEE